MLWRLNLNRRTKSALLFVLSLGTLACAAAAVRFGYIASYGVRDDYLWDTRKITIWYVVEATVGTIAGSLPALKPLVNSIIGTTRRYTSNKASGHQSAVTSQPKGSSGWRSRGSKHLTSATELDDNDSERGLNINHSNETFTHKLDTYPQRSDAHVTTIDHDGYSGRYHASSGDDAGIVKTTTTTLSFLKP